MKASIAHGIRPTALILGKDSGKPWTETDILFAKSYQQYLAELCPQCGWPEYICHNDDNRIHISAKKDECEVTKSAEREQAKLAKDSEKNPLYGTKVYGHVELTAEAVEEGLEFVDFRRPYLIEQAKKRGDLPEDEPTLSE